MCSKRVHCSTRIPGASGRVGLLTLPSGSVQRVFPSPSGHIKERSPHKARIVFFDQLADTTKPYYKTHALLKRIITVEDRLNALYYDVVTDKLPYERYPLTLVSDLLPVVQEFAQDIRQETR